MKIFNLFIPFCLCILGVFYFKGYGIRYNFSDSLPNKLYFSMPSTIPERDQIMNFRHKKSPITFIKIVAGIPGDSIEIRGQSIFINSIYKGEVLPTLQPISDGIIPSEFYFMLGSHSKSFDSRYSEFGLVPLDSIKERLCPIF